MPHAKLAFGAVILLAVSVDMFRTALRVDTYSGPITRHASRLLWRFFTSLRARGRRTAPPSSTGLFIALSVVTIWLLLTLAGWFLIFSAHEGAVVAGSTRAPADGWAILYFSAFVLSTLGVGDYVPNGSVWQVLTGVAATSGFAIVSLMITYVVSLTAAVSEKRRFARRVFALGRSPADIVLAGRSSARPDVLDQHLIEITAELVSLAETHRAFPVLYYFGSWEREAAHWPAVAVLDETLLLLGDLIADGSRGQPDLVIDPARRAIGSYLASLPDPYRHTPEEDPPPPVLLALENAGVPLLPPERSRPPSSGRSRAEPASSACSTTKAGSGPTRSTTREHPDTMSRPRGPVARDERGGARPRAAAASRTSASSEQAATLGDGLVRPTLGNEVEDLSLALGQRGAQPPISGS